MPDESSVKEVKVKFTAAMDEYNKAVQGFKSSTDEVRKQMEQLGTALDEAVDAPAQQMKQWQSQLKRTGTQLDSMDKKAQSLIATQRQLERDIETQTLELSRLDDEYKNIQDELQSTTDMYERISSVTEGIDLGTSIETQLEEANATINRTADEIEELQEKIREASKYGYSIQLDDTSIVSIDEANQRLQRLIEESDLAGQQFEVLSNAMLQLEEQDFDFASTEGMRQLQETIGQLQNELENIGLKAEQAADKLITSGEKYTTVSGEMEDLRGRVSNLGNEMGQMSSQVIAASGENENAFGRIRSAIEQVGPAASSMWSTMGSGARKAASGILSVGSRLTGLRSGNSVLSKLTSSMNSFRGSSDGANTSLTKMVRQIRNISVVSMSLRFVRSIFGSLRSVVNEYLNENEAAKESVDELKSAMANALAPAINIVINMLEKLMPYIEAVCDGFAKLITMIFGVEWTTITGSTTSSGASAAADDLEQVANATNDLAEAEDNLDLEGFDEINKLSAQTDYSSLSDALDSLGSGGGDTLAATTNPSYLMETPAWIENLMDKLQGIWQVFKDAWDIEGEAVIASATSALDSIKQLASDVGNTFYDVFTSQVGVDWCVSLLDMFRSLFDAVGAIADALDVAWTSGLGEKYVESLFKKWQSFYDLVTTIADSFTRVWSDGVGVEICEHLLTIFTNLNEYTTNWRNRLKDAWEIAGDSVWQGVFDIIDSILELVEDLTGATADWAGNLDFTPLLESIGGFLESISGIIEKMSPTIEWLWEDILLPLADWTISELIPSVLDAIGAALDAIGSVGQAAGNILKFIWDNFLQYVADFAGDVILYFLDGLTAILEWIAGNEIVCDILAGIAIAIGAVAAAIAIFNAVMSGGTTLAIIAAIVAIIALVGLVVDNWDSIVDWITTAWQNVCDFFSGVWEDICGIFQDAVDWIVGAFEDAVEWVETAWDNIIGFFTGIWDGIVGVFNDVVGWFGGIFSDAWQAIKNVWDAVVGFFEDIWSGITKAFSDVIDWIGGIFSDAWGAVKEVWDTVVGFFDGIWEDIKGVFDSVANWFGEKFDDAYEAVSGAFDDVGEFFGGVWKNIKGAFGSVSEWFSTTFHEAWEGVKNVFSKGGQIFNDIKEGILNGLGTVINWLIRGINKVIAVPFNAINSALGLIRNVDIFGWKPFSFIGEINVPEIPEIQLATGAVIPPNAPFYAMLGDQTNGNNLEAPESLLRQIVREESGKNNQGNQNIVIKLIMDGKEVGQTVVDFINGQYSAGLNPLNL